jgi:hypothetical protein
MQSTSSIRPLLRFVLFAALFAWLFSAMVTRASAGGTDEGWQLNLLPQSQLWLEGTSTLHPYSSRASRIKVVGRLPSTATHGAPEEAVLAGSASLELTIPVRSLHPEHSGLDSNLYTAMKADKYPDIRFRLTGYLAQPGDKPGSFLVQAAGRLSVAGVEREVELKGTLSTTNDRLQLEGTRELRMTDYGITPPTMFLGALKTDNRVVIHYNIALGLQ